MATLLTTGACIALLCWFENWIGYRSDWAPLTQTFPSPDDCGEPEFITGGVNVADCNPN